MSKYRALFVVSAPPRVESNVVSLCAPRVRPVAPLAPVASAPPRETSWRDLVRRLAKSLAKR
jgi:hypothetical protein